MKKLLNLQQVPDLLKKHQVYAGILIFFFIWMLLFDEYNWIRIFRDKQTLRDLKTDLQYYKEKIEEDRARLHALQTDPEELERFAREQYHLKKKNEELYLIIRE
jgi:cell division protein DivIC